MICFTFVLCLGCTNTCVHVHAEIVIHRCWNMRWTYLHALCITYTHGYSLTETYIHRVPGACMLSGTIQHTSITFTAWPSNFGWMPLHYSRKQAKWGKIKLWFWWCRSRSVCVCSLEQVGKKGENMLGETILLSVEKVTKDERRRVFYSTSR